jgi:HEAT repeat protein
MRARLRFTIAGVIVLALGSAACGLEGLVKAAPAAGPATQADSRREAGELLPQGSAADRVAKSERIFVGRVLDIKWEAGQNVSHMGELGRARVECLVPFRGVKAGEKVTVSVFHPRRMSHSDATLEMIIFGDHVADVRAGDRWLFFLGGYKGTSDANTDIPDETQVGALARIETGKEPIVQQTEQAVKLASLPEKERLAALVKLIEAGRLDNVVMGPYAVSQMVALWKVDGPAAARALAQVLRDTTHAAALRGTVPYNMAELARLATFVQSGEMPDTKLDLLVRRLLLESADSLKDADAELAASYASSVADLGMPADLRVSEPKRVAAVLRTLAARKEVADSLRGTSIGEGRTNITRLQQLEKVIPLVEASTPAAQPLAAPAAPTGASAAPPAGPAAKEEGVAPVVTPEMARLLDRLGGGSAHPAEAAEAHRALIEIGKPAIAPLAWTLMERGPVKDGAKAAATARVLAEMGKAGRPEAFDALIAGLAVGGSAGWECAKALGEIGDRRAVEPLLKSLEGGAQAAVIDALGKLGDPRAVEPILAKLPDKSPGTRGAAARSLAKLGDKRAVEPLIRLLEDKDAEMRCVAAEALGTLRDRRATAPLLALLGDKGFGVPRRALLALGKIGDPAAVEPLLALLEKDELAEPAAAALGEIGDRRAVEPLIKAVEKALAQTKPPLGKGMPAILWAGGEALGRLGDKRAVPLLLDLIQRPQGGDGEFSFAAAALGRIADPESVPQLAKLLRDDKQEFWTRQGAALALCRFRHQAAFDALVLALDDPGARRLALYALGQTGDRRAIRPVERFLSDPDERVRGLSGETLKALRAKDAAPASPAKGP